MQLLDDLLNEWPFWAPILAMGAYWTLETYKLCLKAGFKTWC